MVRCLPLCDITRLIWVKGSLSNVIVRNRATSGSGPRLLDPPEGQHRPSQEAGRERLRAARNSPVHRSLAVASGSLLPSTGTYTSGTESEPSDKVTSAPGSENLPILAAAHRLSGFEQVGCVPSRASGPPVRSRFQQCGAAEQDPGGLGRHDPSRRCC